MMKAMFIKLYSKQYRQSDEVRDVLTMNDFGQSCIMLEEVGVSSNDVSAM